MLKKSKCVQYTIKIKCIINNLRNCGSYRSRSVFKDRKNIVSANRCQNIIHSIVQTPYRALIRFNNVSFMLFGAVGEGDEDLTQLSGLLTEKECKRWTILLCSLSISVLLIIIAFSFMSSPTHMKLFLLRTCLVSPALLNRNISLSFRYNSA